MPTFDASSLILSWHEYSKDLFPPLWDWLGKGFGDGSLAVSQVAFDEVKQKSEACTDFLRDCGLQPRPVTAEIVTEALRLKGLLGILNEEYSPRGVGENDLLIIATANVEGAVLVSEEGRQQNLPNVMKNCKIPAVCGLAEVQVRCVRFIELLRESGQTFGG